MRILQVNKLYYPWIGGIEAHVKILSEELVKNKNEVTVLTCHSHPHFITDKESINGVTIIRASGIGRFFSMPVSLSFFFRLKSLIEDADLVHFHSPFPLSELYHFLKHIKKPYIITWHSDIVRQKFFLPILNSPINNFLDGAKKIIVSSKRIIECSKYIGKYKNKCVTIPFGIDLDRFKPNIGKGKYILFVGRLAYYKGLDYLIKAMKYVDEKLVIIGDGPLKKHLMNLVKREEVDHKILFLGSKTPEELSNIYFDSLFLVLPSISISEAFGLVQLEAMASGKPVINTDLPTAVPEVCPDGECGITVPPCNSRALANAINMLIKDTKLREKLGRNALRRVNRLYNKDKMVDAIIKIYKELI